MESTGGCSGESQRVCLCPGGRRTTGADDQQPDAQLRRLRARLLPRVALLGAMHARAAAPRAARCAAADPSRDQAFCRPPGCRGARGHRFCHGRRWCPYRPGLVVLLRNVRRGAGIRTLRSRHRSLRRSARGSGRRRHEATTDAVRAAGERHMFLHRPCRERPGWKLLFSRQPDVWALRRTNPLQRPVHGRHELLPIHLEIANPGGVTPRRSPRRGSTLRRRRGSCAGNS